MILDSRQIIHMGINYFTIPMPTMDQLSNIRFQDFLLRSGIDVTSAKVQKNQILIGCESPPLKISLIVQAAQPRIGQILIIAPNPQRHLRQFISEVKAILDAFKQAWLWPQRQILRCDVTLRCLYSSTSEHAFQEIWEKRLCRQPDSLTILDRPVHGGGLRFVMPPQLGDPDSAQIELKIESWLRDPKKIFVEVQFLWHQPKPAGTDFAPADRLNRADDYIKKQVHAFMMKGES